MRKGLTGKYKEQFLRSFNEFVFAVYLDKVLGIQFETEPFSLKSPNTKKKKIPDFVYVHPKTKKPTLVEIKGSDEDLEEVIVDYVVNSYIDNSGYEIQFVNLNKTHKKNMINQIISKIGVMEWSRMEEEYKSNARTMSYYGFPGVLNPRYGVKVSEETKQKMRDSMPDRSGMNNSNYGKTHTPEAKLRIAAKWYDESKKFAMIKKGMLTHISRYSDEQYSKFILYAEDIFNGIHHPRPDFLNRAYTLSVNKINTLYGSTTKFLDEIKR